MKIFIITQDEPFYLYKNLKYLISLISNKEISIVGCLVFKVSPFGKNENFISKVFKTIKIFGIRFFIYYSFKYLKSIIIGTSIRNLLIKNNIKQISILGSINNDNNLKLIKSFNPDLLVSILGNQIFKKKLINLAPKGCINLHTSLLPKYRGLMPTFWVLKNNEKFTGVSVFIVDEGIDSGPIIIQKKIKIENYSQKNLIEISKKIGMEALAEAINLIYHDNVKLLPNDHRRKTYYSFPSKKDVLEFKKNKKKFY